MWVIFVNKDMYCDCTNCSYGFGALNMTDFSMYQEEGMCIEDGMRVTPELVSKYFEACHTIFRRQYLDCENYSHYYIPSHSQQWTIPVTLLRHLGFTLKLTPGGD